MTVDSVVIRPALHRVPATAIALAALLHVLVGAMVWRLSLAKPDDPDPEPIMVLFDNSPSNKGLQEAERTGPPAPSAAESIETPTDPPPAETQTQASFPILEFSIPPVPEPPAAVTSRDFLKPVPTPPRAVQRTKPLPPPRPPARQRPPAELPAAMPSPLPGPEPGDVMAGRGRQRNDYLSRVFRHLKPYRSSQASGILARGRVVTRVTLARDGRLIDVRIDTSSGSAALDAAELTAIRKASPFPPLPANMPGDPVILVLPISY